ncbi:hypothetical protein K466DRAFT_67128 [Polyporus arcularius HHB13444]|uniref:Uncharacterized protein n=1 Tax=Polyporus arcularius HHB13444 TaxID=1314778 RepID=A0A5C3PG18_9APHY|nr:hypothetical protein K466DRAFT_67128 [Polyporus arcularius HHB13444]
MEDALRRRAPALEAGASRCRYASCSHLGRELGESGIATRYEPAKWSFRRNVAVCSWSLDSRSRCVASRWPSAAWSMSMSLVAQTIIAGTGRGGRGNSDCGLAGPCALCERMTSVKHGSSLRSPLPLIPFRVSLSARGTGPPTFNIGIHNTCYI